MLILGIYAFLVICGVLCIVLLPTKQNVNMFQESENDRYLIKWIRFVIYFILFLLVFISLGYLKFK